GGDRTSGYELAKNQLFRTLDDVNPIPELQQLEEYVLENANKLGIGTMGFGGETTLLGCKIGVYNRLPASFYVSVAYNCWAYRRLGVTIHPETGEIMDWLYQEGDDTLKQEAQGKTEQREIVLQAPITEEQIRELRVGDVVTINGMMYTGRDAI
ncbi:fumarate hydratase, partial [Bacillus cereus]|nr:fumarate hydratase [Bacillus cereus]